MNRLLLPFVCMLVVAGWVVQVCQQPGFAAGVDAAVKVKDGKKSRQSDDKTPAKKETRREPSAEKKAASSQANSSKTTGEQKSGAKTSEAQKTPAGTETKSPATTEKPKEAEAKPKPPRHKVQRQPIKVEIALDGVFEAVQATEVSLQAEEWNEFEVLKAVEHGTRVRKGDVLVTLDTERIDRTISDLQRELQISAISMQEAELQLQAARSLQPLDAASLERTKRITQEDLERFLKVDRPLSERIVNFMVKIAEDSLAYQEEELRQLEKMYKADDLVEETEEIILKRARDSVERARFTLERMKIERDAILKQTLPRSEEVIKLSSQRQDIEYQRSKVVLPLGPRRLELTLDKLKQENARSTLRLQRLQEDRAAMTFRAPTEGIVYYGRCVRGKWTNAESVAEKLRRGGRLAKNEVFMTVVDPRPIVVRIAVPEKQVQHVAVGLKGFVQPNAFPDLKLTAIVQRVSAVPSSARDFDTTLTLALDDSAKAVMPGMSCEARFIPYFKADALAVPTTAVGSDDLDPRKQYVAVPDKDGKPHKKSVTLGKRVDKYVEVLKGLSEGDEILAEYPKEKDFTPAKDAKVKDATHKDAKNKDATHKAVKDKGDRKKSTKSKESKDK